MPKQRRSLGKRRAPAIFAALLATAVAAPACSEPTRYGVLSFFFDGVPKPGESRPKGYAYPGTAATRDASGRPPERAALRLVSFHPPYRENRCSACHDSGSGLLFRTPQQGLCRRCHPNVPGQVKFLHGPVAVNDCLACHNPHASAYPRLLLADNKALCFRCHKRADLTPGPYHATTATQACIECHNAHGGDTRFFLKKEATVEENK